MGSTTCLKVSVPSNGSFAIEYDVVTGTACFDRDLERTELGCDGASAQDGHCTDVLHPRAGRQLVRLVGPESLGAAQVHVSR